MNTVAHPITVTSRLTHQQVTITAELPAPLVTEDGEISVGADGDTIGDTIHYRLSEEDRTKFAGMANVAITDVPEMVTVSLGWRDNICMCKEQIKGKPIGLRIDTRPQLAALIANFKSRCRAADRARERFWKQEVRDAINARKAQAQQLQGSLPDSEMAAYFVERILGGDDGWGEGTHHIYDIFRTLDGREIDASRGRALVSSPTGTALIVAVPRDTAPVNLREVADREIETDETNKREAEARRAAAAEKRRSELCAIVVPPEAIAAYKRCGGNPESLEDDIDNPDYWLVRKYGDAIEEQGLWR